MANKTKTPAVDGTFIKVKLKSGIVVEGVRLIESQSKEIGSFSLLVEKPKLKKTYLSKAIIGDGNLQRFATDMASIEEERNYTIATIYPSSVERHFIG